jgi:hypothetical protein
MYLRFIEHRDHDQVKAALPSRSGVSKLEK